ncbi:MAG: hypothetical protein HRT72_13900 [Flavobacteriales bacterium]|nr:hypothetical protein [Flavobacteriales bacterium]
MGEMKNFNKSIENVWKNKSEIVKDDKYLNIYIEKRNDNSEKQDRKIDTFKRIHIKKDRKTSYAVTKIKSISMIDHRLETRVSMKDLVIERNLSHRQIDISQTTFFIYKN